MPKFYRVRAEKITRLISVFKDTIRIVHYEAEEALAASYPGMFDHDLEQDITNLTFAEFAKFAKKHEVLSKMSWERIFGFPRPT
ncbi:hypothetical protein ACFLZK_01475 [Patescibacteria group bacterium]